MGEKTKKKNKGLRGFKVLSVSLSADNVDDKNETRSIYYKKHNAKKKYTGQLMKRHLVLPDFLLGVFYPHVSFLHTRLM